jgi:hypothetical protein
MDEWDPAGLFLASSPSDVETLRQLRADVVGRAQMQSRRIRDAHATVAARARAQTARIDNAIVRARR